MENFITLDVDRLIFVSFEKGSGGHGIARTLCSLPDVYWYSHPDNGINPWNIASAKTSNIRQRKIAPKHFDRWIKGFKIPPTPDYLKDYNIDTQGYLSDVFLKGVEKALRMTSKRLVFPTHLTPFELKGYFGTTIALNVLYDANKTVKRHLLTTSKFPAYVKFADILPSDNEYLKFLKTIHTLKPTFTVADVWAMKKYNKLYNKELEEEYYNETLSYMETRLAIRNESKTDSTVCTIHQDNVDWKKVKTYLNSL